MLAALALGARILLLNEYPAHADVGQAVDHLRFRGCVVAPSPADLLIIGLDAAGQVGVEDETHVRLIDPHAEGDGGDDDHARIGHENVLVRLPFRLRHARVIGKRPHPVRRQQDGGFLRLLARQAIDDSALAFMARNEVPQLALPVAFHLHRQLDIRTVKAKDNGLHRTPE